MKFMQKVQFVCGFIHTYSLLCACFLAHNADEETRMVYVTRGCILSSMYFFADLLYILFLERSQWPFMIHHYIAILLYLLTYKTVLDVNRMLDYLTCIELSNVCISIWYMAKENKERYRTLYDTVSPLFAVTYIPIRTFLLAWITWDAAQSASGPLPMVLLARVMLCGLQIMSWMFSYQLFRMAKAKLPLLRNTLACSFYRLIDPLSDPYWFNMIVYFVKFYYDLYQIYHGALNNICYTRILLVDMAHIIVSLVYYACDCPIILEKLDYLAILTKIGVNASCYRYMGYVPNDAGYVLFWLVNIGILVSKWGNHFVHNRYRLALLISGYLIAVYPMIRSHVHSELCMYAFAGFVWGIRFPEAWFSWKGCQILNSLGWMHVLVWMGDEDILRRLQTYATS